MNEMDFVKKYERELENLDFPTRPNGVKRSDYKNNAEYGKALDIYEKQDDEWRTALANYHIAENETCDRFRKHLIGYFKLENHPKVDKMYELAWDRGHASGLYDVTLEFETLADLIKE